MTCTRNPRGPGAARFGPVGDFTLELGDAFVRLVAETGNYRASARTLGHRHLFENRMRRHPDFRRRCEAAAAAADARLRREESPFPRPPETKSMPPEAEGRPPRGEKRPANGEPVIRRTSNGRTQISHVREGGWTAAAEADFLALLRETGNFDWSARAVGFNPVTLYRRQEEWPAFARGCCEALEQAEVRLNYRLVAYAHALLRPPGGETGAEPDGGPPAMPFDPEAAMRILAFLDRRRDGGTTRGRRKGAPERSFDEVAASILGKIEAIERHEAMYGKRADGGDAPPAPDPGGGQDP